MAGYIGSKSSVTLVDGYSESEADAEFVTKTGDTMSGNLDVTGTVTSDGLIINNGVVKGERGTASAPAYSFGDDADTGMFNISNANLGFSVSGTERMRIDSSGNVGIGTSSIASGGAGTTNLNVHTPSATSTYLKLSNTGTGNAASDGFDLSVDSSGNAYLVNRENGFLGLYTNAAERMRIDSSGNVGIGCSPTYRLDVDSGGSVSAARLRRNTDGSLRTVLLFLSRSNSNTVGSISISNSATAYNTSSDYRLKENVVDLTGASARVNQLDVKRFNFIADDTNTLVDGFLAHEVATVVPEAITGTKDAMKDEEYEVTPATGDIYTPSTDAYVDDDGNDVDAVDEVIHSADAEQPETLEDGQQWRETTAPVMGTRSVPDYQGIDQSKLVPLLTAALQEALTEIASLKTRVEALEA